MDQLKEIIELTVPILSMAIAAASLLGVYRERRAAETKNDAIMSQKLEQQNALLVELKDMITGLTNGYNSNEKRITLLEDRYKNLSGRVNNLETKGYDR